MFFGERGTPMGCFICLPTGRDGLAPDRGLALHPVMWALHASQVRPISEPGPAVAKVADRHTIGVPTRHSAHLRCDADGVALARRG